MVDLRVRSLHVRHIFVLFVAQFRLGDILIAAALRQYQAALIEFVVDTFHRFFRLGRLR